MLKLNVNMVIAIRAIELLNSARPKGLFAHDLVDWEHSPPMMDFAWILNKLIDRRIIRRDAQGLYHIVGKRHLTAMDLAKAFDCEPVPTVGFGSRAVPELEMRLEAAFLGTRII
jgi:hypothetical protein